MRRLLSSLAASLTWIALVFSIGLAAIWHRTLHTQDSVQYIAPDGTTWSLGTGVASLTFTRATRYPEMLKENRVDWLWSAAPGWSSQTFDYNVPYNPPTPATRPATQPVGARHPRTEYILPVKWNTRLLGFDWGADRVRLRTGGKGAFCRDVFVTLPLWFLILVLATPGLIWGYFLRFGER